MVVAQNNLYTKWFIFTATFIISCRINDEHKADIRFHIQCSRISTGSEITSDGVP